MDDGGALPPRNVPKTRVKTSSVDSGLSSDQSHPRMDFLYLALNSRSVRLTMSVR